MKYQTPAFIIGFFFLSVAILTEIFTCEDVGLLIEIIMLACTIISGVFIGIGISLKFKNG